MWREYLYILRISFEFNYIRYLKSMTCPLPPSVTLLPPLRHNFEICISLSFILINFPLYLALNQFNDIQNKFSYVVVVTCKHSTICNIRLGTSKKYKISGSTSLLQAGKCMKLIKKIVVTVLKTSGTKNQQSCQHNLQNM